MGVFVKSSNHRRHTYWALVVGAFLTLGSFSVFAAESRQYLVQNPPAVLASAMDPAVVAQIASLRGIMGKKASVRVIVGLRVPFAPEGGLSGVSGEQQRSEIANVQQALSAQLTPSGALIHAAYTTIPFMALTVNAAGLDALLVSPHVISLEEDRLASPSLAESVPLIGGNLAWTRGYTGAGQHVAILDTGVDKTHSFLTGKVVSEACYSTNSPGDTASSVCPGGVTASTAVGSGVNCNVGVDGCTHGTHVAGITAGKGASFSGVAKEASLIAVQVFSRFEVSSGYCSGSNPCALSYNSDQIKGLERVYALRSTYSIAAVNMSLGGGRYYSQATCDSATASTKAAIDNLRSVNIATVIASGNSYYSDSMGSPGCISTAVSVGATTKADVVASYSNGVSFLNLLAPGSAINSSIPGNAYASWNGTSMATPHVAGAWAVLKGGKPTATVTEVLNALYSTGVDIVDSRNGLHFRRINVNSALTALVPAGNRSLDWLFLILMD